MDCAAIGVRPATGLRPATGCGAATGVGPAQHRDRPRTFPAIEDALGWPHRRIASVLGGVCRLRQNEFSGRRPYHFNEPRTSGSRRWEMWMDAGQARAVRAEQCGRSVR